MSVIPQTPRASVPYKGSVQDPLRSPDHSHTHTPLNHKSWIRPCFPPPKARLTNIRNHRKITKANYKFYLKNIYRWKTKQANKRKRKQNKNCDTFLVLCDLVLSTIKQHIYAKPVKWSVRLFLDNITLMFLLNFQVEVIINMFIKREPTPYKEHEVNTPYFTSNFRDWRFVYGVFGGKTCRVWFVL